MGILNGDTQVIAHGAKDMPMWGPIFNKMSTNASISQMRIHALLQYLEDIQAK